VRTGTLEAFAHPDVPFALLAEETGMDRDPSRPPLVQVALNLLTFPSAGGELPGGTRLERLSAARVDARYDLGLYVVESDGGLHLHVIYDAPLFVPERIDGLLRDYRQILEEALLEEP
jgi:non-ribosomal peptide synthetase component F